MLKLKLQYFGLLRWRTDSWCEELTLKRLWCWERLKVGGEGDDRGWDVWMASVTQWTWVWASSRRGQRTGQPGVLQSMGLQRVWHDSATEQQQNQTKMFTKKKKKIHIKDYNFKNYSFLSSWFQGKKCQWEVFCICISEVYFSNVYTVTWKTETGSRHVHFNCLPGVWLFNYV